jgi:hypothetical protein
MHYIHTHIHTYLSKYVYRNLLRQPIAQNRAAFLIWECFLHLLQYTLAQPQSPRELFLLIFRLFDVGVTQNRQSAVSS